MHPLSRLALGTRLALLAAFAAGSLGLATFVAWRLARTTDAFATRQAELSLQAAVGQLAREIHEFPNGRSSLGSGPLDRRAREGRAPGPPPPPAPPAPPLPPPPPPERLAFELFSDPLARSAAIALHPSTNVSGGFAGADGGLVGYASPSRASTRAGTEPAADERAAIASAIADARAQQELVVRSVPRRGSVMLVAASPLTAADAESSGLVAAVAVETLRSMSAATDPTNLLAAAGLIASFTLVIGFALLTVRDLQRGVRAIEQGLDRWTSRDEAMPPPSAPELARIAVAINAVALESRTRREHELALERELQQQEHLAALGRLVAAVAHEVRNPLAAMRLKVQMAERAGYAVERFASTSRVIVEEIDRLDGLVRRLLELGRPAIVRRQAVDLTQLVRARLTLSAERIALQQVDLVIDAGAGPLWVDADPDRLAQVFDNLIQNALDAMPHGGRLTATCAATGDPQSDRRAVVSIADTGPGVAAADRARLFEPFFTARDGGTGLGLAIAREIVDAHGGQLVIADAAGAGATFRLEFPIGAAPA